MEKKLKDEEKIKFNDENRLDIKQEEKIFNGTVKWFNGNKGYGFIKRKDNEKDIFVHFSAVKEAGLKHLKQGDELTFEVENTDKGLTAVKLQKTSNFEK